MKRGSWAEETANSLAKKPGLNLSRYSKQSKDVAMNPCRCTICGEVLDCLTYVHSAKCGYPDKYEMLRLGLVKPLANLKPEGME